MTYLSVKNFDRFQHYKDRRPPWIKLYTALLDDYEFTSLPDVTRAHLLLLWVLASCVDNKIPNDPAWVRMRIGANEPVDLAGLIAAGWLEEYNESRAAGRREDWSSRYVSQALRAKIMERDGKKCVTCRSTEHLEIDHIVAISKGGTGEEANLQTLCRRCNRVKRFATPSASAEDAPTQKRSLEGEREAETETDPAPSSPHAKDVFPEVVAALTTADDPALLDDLLARVGDRPDAHRAYLAECNAALAGLHGASLSVDELRVAARDFVTNRATPNMKLFRGYLRNAKRRPVEVGTPATKSNGRHAKGKPQQFDYDNPTTNAEDVKWQN